MVQGFEEGVWRCGIQDKWFDRGMKWNIGVGDKTRFWVDSWVDGNCLANLFPRLYLISEQKFEVVGKMGSWRDERWCWEIWWRRELFEWKREAFLSWLMIFVFWRCRRRLLTTLWQKFGSLKFLAKWHFFCRDLWRIDYQLENLMKEELLWRKLIWYALCVTNTQKLHIMYS